ncbi:MAG: glycosyltransferase family 2 protein [Candidatus Zixiibacteriota bacterium]|nr:MAG: glycosyltransferase family 2 protein [candidate division Zixibacteria bacterium]
MISKVLVAVVAYNEGERLRRLWQQFPVERDYGLVLIDDGSTDQSTSFLENTSVQIIRHERNLGVGAAIRSAVEYARREGFQVLVIMAGNGKMLPSEICRLITPILEDRADYVQGSRYLEGGASPNLPWARNLAIRALTCVTSLIVGTGGTDITCGFRAYRTAILDRPEIDMNQDWLNRYEMEYYIHIKVIKLGYRITEVPVSMVYPGDRESYSKIRPVTGWWSMLRPWLYLLLRLKH